METIRIVDERAPYLLIAHKDRFAVVERRSGKLYNPHCGHRMPALMTDAGARSVVGEEWCDETTAPYIQRRSYALRGSSRAAPVRQTTVRRSLKPVVRRAATELRRVIPRLSSRQHAFPAPASTTAS